MAKLLRLDVAQLTDVGRKREHNEDNMAYVIPKDLQVMTRKGALFIVADGMGGHAAGEVASEIAVDTVSNTYYQDENDDVPTSLLQAIRRANTAIHQRAAENMLRSGMGTTCVASVLRGNVAYIANIGDSRAYIVRQGHIHQVSQDHSWVAEQVRAGLLSEEQARTHAQRNVITRSLGTQPEVEIDLFREELKEGDILILCSDGLSGLVNDEELQRTVSQFVPQESVYHLIERANENGGPDNITAIVVHVQDVGVEQTDGLRQPVPVGGPALSNEDTARFSAPAPAGFNPPAYRNDLLVADGPSSYGPYGSPSLASADSDTIPHPAVVDRGKRGRLFYPTLVLAILFLLVVGSGGYYLVHTANQSQTVNQILTEANTLINQANGEINTNPTQALHDLSGAQQKLQDLQKNYQLDSTSSARLSDLQKQLVGETQMAITRYNQNGRITLLPCAASTPGSLNGTLAGPLAIISANNTTLTYTLGQDGKMYQLSSNDGSQYTLGSPFTLGGETQITGITAARNQIFVLSQQVKNGTPGNFVLTQLIPGQHGLQPGKTPQNLDQKVLNSKTPSLITAWFDGTNVMVYVLLASSSDASKVTVLGYSVDTAGVFSGPTSSEISVSYPVISLAAAANQLFLLETDGSVSGAAISSDHKIAPPAPVLVNQPLAAPLAVSSQNFMVSTDVPTATPTTQNGSVPLHFPFGQSSPILRVATVPPANGTGPYHLFIGDPTNHRVLDLAPPPPPATVGGPGQTPTATATTTSQGGSLTLALVQQYVSLNYFSTLRSVAINPDGTTLTILSQSASSSENVLAISTNAQKVCG